MARKMIRDEKGRLVKGAGGRNKGEKSVKGRAWEEMKDFMMGDGLEMYMKYLKKLPSDKYVQRFEAMVEFFQPKLSRAEVQNSGAQELLIKHIVDDNAQAPD